MARLSASMAVLSCRIRSSTSCPWVVMVSVLARASPGTAQRSTGCERRIRQASTINGVSCRRGGGPADEALLGTSRRDTCEGAGGNDDLEGAGGSDRLFGGDGADRVFGRFGNDFMRGGTGNDQLQGGRGNDTMLGGAGITLDHSVMRHMNNLETVITYEGTEEMHMLSIGAAVTGLVDLVLVVGGLIGLALAIV